MDLISDIVDLPKKKPQVNFNVTKHRSAQVATACDISRDYIAFFSYLSQCSIFFMATNWKDGEWLNSHYNKINRKGSAGLGGSQNNNQITITI